jgi:hypothetical protein
MTANAIHRLGTITYAVFDPIRAFFVESKLKGSFNFERASDGQRL